MNVFELAAKLTLDTSDFDKGLSAVGGKLKKAGKTIGIALGAASAAVTGLTKSAVTAYAEYEQLTGGTALMLGDAYDSVIERSQNAYKTVQMSQNDYLTQVNRFATGLKNSMGGSEQAAADLSHRILLAEADIVAAVGVSQETVQTAFAAVMRNNYTMLDNLGIGIRGTKQGMEDVITIVNEWNAEQGKATNYQMDNYADMQNALIDYVEMVGLAGYAQMEAENTIQGSVASMKAAWQNLLVALSAGNGFQQQMDALVESARTAFNNILPIVENFLVGFAELMKQVGPMIVEKLPEIIENVVPSVLDAAVQIVGALVEALPGILQAIVTVIGGLVDSISTYLNERWPEVGQVFDGIVSAITTALGAISTFWTETLQPAFASMWNYITDEFAPAVSGIWSDYISPTIQAAMSAISGFWGSTLKPAFQSIYSWLSKTLGPAFDTVAAAINGDEAAMSELRDIFKVIGPIIVGVTTAFAAYALISKTVEVVTLAVKAAQLLLNAAMSANPIVLVISLLAGLAAALVTAYNANEEFRKKVDEAWAAVKEAAIKLRNDIQSKFNDIKDKIESTWNNIKQWSSDTWDNVKTTVTTKATDIRNDIQSKWNDISTKIETAWNNIKTWSSETWDNVRTTVTTKAADIRNDIQSKWNDISTKIETTWNNIKTWSSDTWDNVKTTVITKATDIRNDIQSKWNDITTKIEAAWNNIKTWSSETWNNVSTTISDKATSIRSDIQSKWNDISTKIEGTWNNISTWTSSTWSRLQTDVTSAIQDAWSTVSEKATSIWSDVKNAWQSIKDIKWSDIGSSLWSSFVDGVQSAIDAISSLVGWLGEWLGFNGKTVSIKTNETHTITNIAKGGGGRSGGNQPHADQKASAMDTGYIYRHPTVFGYYNGKAQIAGDVGAEAVVGVYSLDKMIQNSVNAAVGRTQAAMVGVLSEILDKMPKGQLVLDTGALVGGIAPEMNNELERITAWSGGGRA